MSIFMTASQHKMPYSEVWHISVHQLRVGFTANLQIINPAVIVLKSFADIVTDSNSDGKTNYMNLAIMLENFPALCAGYFKGVVLPHNVVTC